MRIMRSISDLKKVYTEMLKRPCVQNELTILGSLVSAIKGLWKYEVVLDKWPDFSALILRPLDIIGPRKSLYREVYIYGETESVKQLLLSKEILPWKECITFRVCPVNMKTALQDVARLHRGSVIDPQSSYQYYQAKDAKAVLNIDVEKLTPEGFRIGPLQQCHMPYIHNLRSQYAKEGDSTMTPPETQNAAVRDTFSSCMFDPEGVPVSWVMGYYSGESIEAFTHPDHRGSHLYSLVALYLIQQALRFGQVHAHALADTRNKSIQSAVKLQFMALPQLLTYFHYIPKGNL